jgi:hypothetical protein
LKTPDITPEQMQSRVARFKDVLPTKASFTEQNIGVPGEAYELIAAHSVYSLLAPAGNKRNAAKPAITGAPGLEVVIANVRPARGRRCTRIARPTKSSSA